MRGNTKTTRKERKNALLTRRGALKVFFFQNGGGKNEIKLTKSGQGEVLRPETKRSDRPEARQNSGFGWRGHKKLKTQSIIENPKLQ